MMLQLQPKAGGEETRETREEKVLWQIKAVESRLPTELRKEDISDGLRRLGGSKPLNLCLSQELYHLSTI